MLPGTHSTQVCTCAYLRSHVRTHIHMHALFCTHTHACECMHTLFCTHTITHTLASVLLIPLQPSCMCYSYTSNHAHPLRLVSHSSGTHGAAGPRIRSGRRAGELYICKADTCLFRHLDISISIHMHAHRCIHKHIHAYMHTHTHTRTQTLTHTHTHTNTDTHTYAHTLTHTKHTNPDTHERRYTPINTYAHTYTHIGLPIPKSSSTRARANSEVRLNPPSHGKAADSHYASNFPVARPAGMAGGRHFSSSTVGDVAAPQVCVCATFVALR